MTYEIKVGQNDPVMCEVTNTDPVFTTVSLGSLKLNVQPYMVPYAITRLMLTAYDVDEDSVVMFDHHRITFRKYTWYKTNEVSYIARSFDGLNTVATDWEPSIKDTLAGSIKRIMR